MGLSITPTGSALARRGECPKLEQTGMAARVQPNRFNQQQWAWRRPGAIFGDSQGSQGVLWAEQRHARPELRTVPVSHYPGRSDAGY
jgi:hypothetical protein